MVQLFTEGSRLVGKGGGGGGGRSESKGVVNADGKRRSLKNVRSQGAMSWGR